MILQCVLFILFFSVNVQDFGENNYSELKHQE